MINLGLAGAAGSGKDTVADYLVKRYGFIKYSFSDALYREVAEAFQVDEDMLRDREKKDTPSPDLYLWTCTSKEFQVVMLAELEKLGAQFPSEQSCSPRQILQWWGTEYRRAQDPDYWIKKADEWIYDLWGSCQYPEQQPQFFVNTSVRFESERAWIHKFASGNVWHIRRETAASVSAHVSEVALRVLHDERNSWFPEGVSGCPDYAKLCYERELFNNDSIYRLHKGIDLLLGTGAQCVKVEPMLPYSKEEK